MVELSLTMAIMAVLAAIAIPRYAQAISSYRAKAAAQRLVNDLSYVQSVARTTSSSRTITFTTDQYSIANMRDLETAASTYTVQLSAEPYNAKIASKSLTGGRLQIVFDGYGVPDCGGSFTLQAGNSSRIVTLDAATGRATVQ